MYRDGHPRVSLTLPGVDGTMRVEFILDTGFDGDITLLAHIVQRLNVAFAGMW